MAKANIHGRIRPETLLPETRRALMELKQALAAEPFIKHAQITIDEVHNFDLPPTVDLQCEIPSRLLEEVPQTELKAYCDQFESLTYTVVYV